MKIDFIEIRNFRRLTAVRVDFADRQTLLVGANNSGKTSAMTALRYFLKDPQKLRLNDFSLNLRSRIDDLGVQWESKPEEPVDIRWGELFPSLDVWLKISEHEIHRVAHLIPTLDWSPEEGIGVRLQMEPKDSEALKKEYLKSRRASCETMQAARSCRDAKTQVGCNEFCLWPQTLTDFLNRNLTTHIAEHAYLLDPSQKRDLQNGLAQPQDLNAGAFPLEGNPFDGLMQIDEISAQRGFSDDLSAPGDSQRGNSRRLSEQLGRYYTKHLDPEKSPDTSDVQALEAIHEAQQAFDERLKAKFFSPLSELENFGYPGVTNPRLSISTQLKPLDGLNHSSAVLYEVAAAGDSGVAYKLPEQSNGLGYQNLISMAFRLISFRDDRMRVGKKNLDLTNNDGLGKIPLPLHLVLIEEPEAHLHVQVQQVFIRKAYDFLRNHPDLKDSDALTTQLMVSTHSSHIAHEVKFADLRYFKRLPARTPRSMPYSTVVNLSEVFDSKKATAKFVSRYLRAGHSDIFFADGVVFIEGTAERLLVPHFIRETYEQLHRSYLSLFEVGGSHSHRFIPLIKKLGINALVITDLDSIDIKTKTKTPPAKDDGVITSNPFLKIFYARQVRELLLMPEDKKEIKYEGQASIRVAYQIPIEVSLDEKSSPLEFIPRTFEDAFIYDNIDALRAKSGRGLLKKIHEILNDHTPGNDIGEKILEALESANKGNFALDMLYSKDPSKLQAPTYIRYGLEWLQSRLQQMQTECQ